MNSHRKPLIIVVIFTTLLAVLALFFWHFRPGPLNQDTPDTPTSTTSDATADTTPPTFVDYPEIIHITQGTHGLDLLAGITATDDIDEPHITLQGNYDPDRIGTYQLSLIATDSSSNQTIQPLTIVITSDYVVGGKRVWQGKFTTSKGFPVEIRDGVTYIDHILVANKANPVPADYAPGVTAETNAAYERMRQAAANDGYTLTIKSGFRSYQTQAGLYSYYVNRDGFTAAETYSSRAGYSEHQTGLALDLNWVDNSFAYTTEAKWLNDNAYKYGFILRYLQGKEDLTGFMYEPWHFRYVGTDLAKTLYNNGNWISLEEHFGIRSVYDPQGYANF